MSFDLATILRESARTYPDKPAVLVEGGRLTYGELEALSDRFAAGLHAGGIAPGDTVGLQLPNVPQFIVAYFGILKAGAVAVPINVPVRRSAASTASASRSGASRCRCGTPRGGWCPPVATTSVSWWCAG